jgi:glycosyltransferase involved in cell wall biosynthesis
MTSVRILHVLAPAPFGGLERVVQSLSGAQAGVGHELLVVAVGARDQEVRPFLRTLEGSGAEGRALLVPHRHYRSERRAFGEILASFRPDILQTHGYRTDVVEGPVGRKLGIRTVGTAHGFTGGGIKNSTYEWIQCWAYRGFDAAVAVAKNVAERIRRRGVPRRLIRVIPNSVAVPELVPRTEARAFFGVSDQEFHIGWIGRISPEKGPDVMVEALARLGERDGLRVSFLGAGPLEEPLRRRIAVAGLEGTVRFSGVVANASRLFRGLDLVVLSSRTEGTPMVLLEAMAAGIPVLATAVGGVPDVVTDREALLVPGEDPGALAVALRFARGEPEAGRTRAAAALQRFRAEFSLGAWVARYDQLYRDLMEGRSASRG